MPTASVRRLHWDVDGWSELDGDCNDNDDTIIPTLPKDGTTESTRTAVARATLMPMEMA